MGREINWLKIGLLVNSPKDKQSIIISNLNYALNILIKDYSDENWGAEEWIIPIIIRINNIIDIDKIYVNNVIIKIIEYRKKC